MTLFTETDFAMCDVATSLGYSFCLDSTPITPVCGWSIASCAGSYVTTLSITSQGRSGTISPAIGMLSSLAIVSMRSNSIGGSIPSMIGKLLNLKSLDLGNNLLTGLVPSTVGSLSQLLSLDVSNNKLQ